jgi:hypothetical protein
MAKQEQRVPWIRIDERKLVDLQSEFKRYRLMFRILFGYLIFDVLVHFDFLN